MPESGAASPARERLEILLREGRSLSGRERNAVFLNTGDARKRFANASAVSGFDAEGDGRGMALTDSDGDGDLDIWISNRTAPMVQFFENRHGSRAGGFVALDLVGTTCNRDAIGARVSVRLNDGARPLLRTLRAGEGFQSQSSKRLHFGLGRGAEIAEVRVRWPGAAEEEVFAGVEANAVHKLQQGAGKARRVAPSPRPVFASDAPAAPSAHFSRNAALPIRMPFPRLIYRVPGADAPTRHAEGRPLLVVVWRAECDRCQTEMAQLARNADAIRSLGLDCLALTTGSVAVPPAFPFPVGTVDSATIERMLVFHRHLFYRPYHFTVPTAFLLDARHRLAAIYRDGVDLDRLEKHGSLLALEGAELAAHVRPYPGTRLDIPPGERPTRLIKDYIENGMPDEGERLLRTYSEHENVAGQRAEIARTLGESYLFAADYPAAKRLLREALALDPRQPTSLNNLGAIALAEGKPAEAVRLWRKSCAMDDAYPAPRLNLGKQLMKAGMTEEAMPVLRAFAKLEPESADGHRYLAMGHLRQQDFDNAELHLTKLIQLSPNDGDAYANLARLHVRKRNIEAARKVLDTALATSGLTEEQRKRLTQLRGKLGK